MSYFLIGLLLGLAVGFYIGGDHTMRAVRIGAKWRLSYDENRELDRLMEKALAKRGEQ